MLQGKINRGRHTDHPDGRHSIRTKQLRRLPSPIPHSEIYSKCTVPRWPSKSLCAPQEWCLGFSQWNLQSGIRHGRQNDEWWRKQSTSAASQSAHFARVCRTVSDTSSDQIHSATEQQNKHECFSQVVQSEAYADVTSKGYQKCSRTLTTIKTLKLHWSYKQKHYYNYGTRTHQEMR